MIRPMGLSKTKVRVRQMVHMHGSLEKGLRPIGLQALSVIEARREHLPPTAVQYLGAQRPLHERSIIDRRRLLSAHRRRVGA